MTIDELMEGKEPGSIRVCLPEWSEGRFFSPYFRTKTDWHGLNENLTDDYWSATNCIDWHLYEEPKPKRKIVLHEYCNENIYDFNFIWAKEGAETQWLEAGWKPTGETRTIEVDE